MNLFCFKKKEVEDVFPDAESMENICLAKVKENQKIYLETLKRLTAKLIRQAANTSEQSLRVYPYKDNFMQGSNLYDVDRRDTIIEFIKYLQDKGYTVDDSNLVGQPVYQFMGIKWSKKNEKS